MSKSPIQRRGKSIPSSPHKPLDFHHDDITELFLATSGSIATTIHVVSSTKSATTLNATRVLTKSKSSFIEKYLGLVSDGPDSLKIVADFNFTMTKYYVLNASSVIKDSDGRRYVSPMRPHINPVTESNGSSLSAHIKSTHTEEKPEKEHNANLMRGITCYSVLEDSQLFGRDYQLSCMKTFRKYHPLETDAHIAYEKKFQYMVEWAKETQNSLIYKAHLTSALLDRAVKEAVAEKRIDVRNQLNQFLEYANEASVPVLVLSSGIADIAEKVLAYSIGPSESLTNVTVLGNRCKFDDVDGKLLKFEEPLVHPFNKKAGTFSTTAPYIKSEDEESRKSILLLGDSANDILLTNGLTYDPSKILKIGFLNDKVNDRIDSFVDIFDIVIVGDEAGFEIPCEVLKNICRIGGGDIDQNVVLQDEIKKIRTHGRDSICMTVVYDKDISDTGYNAGDGFEVELDIGDYGSYGL